MTQRASTQTAAKEQILLKNLKIIGQRWPLVHNILTKTQTTLAVSPIDQVPEPTIMVDGIHLSSAYNQRAEAELQASLVPKTAPEAWVYGIGCGALPRALLERDKTRRLTVFVMNPGVASLSFTYFDQTDWLKDPRLNMLFPGPDDEIRTPFAANPACLMLADDNAARIRDLVFLELATPFIHQKAGAQNIALQQAITNNIDYIRNDHDVAELYGIINHSTIIIAAAGPTLSDHYDRLKEKGHYLIAVDAALKPLCRAGIHPDLVITVDPKENVLDFFKDIDLRPFINTPLVYFPVVNRKVLEIWPGPRFTAYSDHISTENPKGILFSSGNVLHPAADLAVKAGADKILLMGTDFSFPYGKSHVKNSDASFFDEKNDLAVDISRSRDWVLNGHGKRVASTPSLKGYLRDFERYIPRHPETTFVNMSRRGALIKGTYYPEEINCP